MQSDKFNPAMLATAREAQFLSQAELADRIRTSQPLVGRWEAGSALPDTEQIAALSVALKVRPGLFFVDRPRRLASMSDYYHRALARARRKDVKAVHARCSILDIQIDRLLRLAEPINDQIPSFDPEEDPPERIAALTRQRMSIGPGPIANLVEVIERHGAIIIDRDLEVPDVDAICRWVPELPKLFFLNGSKPPDRIRFSLAHELGHTVMHFDRDLDQKTAEDQANEFAAAFLMPAEDIRRDLRGKVTIADLAAIKRKWRVAMQAAAKRALSVGAIDKSRYQWLFVQMSKNGWRKVEPIHIGGETPTTFVRLLRSHRDAGFSRSDLANLLFVEEDTIDKMLIDAEAPTFQRDGVRLRVVRE
jgi:Zn-dependent peptidase ImmA (M78 family)